MTENPYNSPSPTTVSGMRIGLLGGSFNPAHQGHRFISMAALERLGLDQVWWLVAPQNPLKSEDSLAPLKTRLAGADKISKEKNILVMDLEGPLGFEFTVDTLGFLKAQYPQTHFIWLMGADCLGELHKWKSWEKIMASIPLGVFSRPGYEAAALGGKAATHYKKYRVMEEKFKSLVVTEPPAWGYIGIEGQDISGTRLRAKAS